MTAPTDLLRNLIASSVDGILAFDRECRYTVWNPSMERISGCAAADVVGRVAFEVFPFLEEIGEDAYFHAALAGEDAIARDRPFTIPHTGKQGWFEGFYGPLRDQEGRVVGGLAIIRDITDRKELEEKLRRSQQLEAIGHLAGGIAHDFNNILAGIMGWAEILQRSLPPNPDLRNAADEIKACSVRAAALTQRLLTFSRGDVSHPEVVDVNAAIESASGLLERLIPENITFDLSLDPSRPHVLVDRGQLERVLVNLALNARDAMPCGGRIELRSALERAAEDDVPWVVLSIEDTGCGMDAETSARIFEPFFTTKPPGKGTGLGLATVHRAIEQAGGRLDLRSVVGQGTTFRVYLPPCSQTGEIQRDAEALATPVGRGERVLVVEDDPSVRRLVVRVLSGAGYDVLESGDGREALDLAAAQPRPIDLLVTDVVLPHVGGGVLAERLATAHPKMKVLFMTGYSDDSLVEHRLGEQLASLLHKPFATADLVTRVRETLDAC